MRTEGPESTSAASDGAAEPPRLDEHALRALEPGEIRARRRPRAVAYVWLWELACGLLVATPVHAWAQRVWGAHPDGDAVLFRPGGHALLAWLGGDDAALAVVTQTTLLTLLVCVVLGQIVTGALVAALATGTGRAGRAPRGLFALRAGLDAFWPLAGLGVVAAIVEGFLLGVGLFTSSTLDGALADSLGDARAFTARLAVLAVFVALALLTGVVADLARVAIARDVALSPGPRRVRARMRDGVVAAIHTARATLGRAALAWGWRAAAALALVYVGGRAGELVGGRGGAALLALFAVHQLVVLVRAALRASWLANALRLLASTRG